MLTPQTYDIAERTAMETTANRIVECSRAVTFGEVGYPIKIESVQGAARYVDVMHEGRAEATVRDILFGFSPEELDLMEAVASKTAAMSERLYGKRVVPRDSLLRSLNIVRHIRYFRPSPATVLEIGPGSGYVGAMLLELGYGYAAIDVAQAFYVYQSHLMAEFARNGFSELAIESGTYLDRPAVALGSAVHVPWWKFIVPEPVFGTGLDVATCNHAFCEMHAYARNYTMRAIRAFVGDSGALLFEGWGSTVLTPIWHTGRDIARAGMVFAHNDTLISAAVGATSASARAARGFPMPGAPKPDAPEAFHPHIHIEPKNPIGARILDARRQTKAAATKDLAALDARLRPLGLAPTDDERFLRFLELNL